MARLNDTQRACYHIMSIWQQYGPCYEVNGEVHLSHQNMQAGETATDYLVHHGYVIDDGYSAKLTPAGRHLLEYPMAMDDWPEEQHPARVNIPWSEQRSDGWGRGMFIAGAAAGVTPTRKNKL